MAIEAGGKKWGNNQQSQKKKHRRKRREWSAVPYVCDIRIGQISGRSLKVEAKLKKRDERSRVGNNERVVEQRGQELILKCLKLIYES